MEAERWGLFLGPDKAGSSWLQRFLAWHPQASVPVAKELFFFDRYYDRGWTWYDRQFPRAGEIRIEVCHDYLFSHEAARRVSRDLPDARLVVSARHPVKRAVSAHQYMVRQGRASEDLEASIRTIAELVDHGRYGHHLENWAQHVSTNRLHLLDFSRLVADTLGYAHDVCEVFGLEWVDPPDQILAPTRRASSARWQPLATAGKKTAGALRALRLQGLIGRLKDDAGLERILFREGPRYDAATLSPSLLAQLEEELRPDARTVDDRFGTDFETQWWGRSHE